MELLISTLVPPDDNANENLYQREDRLTNAAPVSLNIEPPITPEELDLALKNTKKKKAPGPGRIPPYILISLNQNNRFSLLALLNLCLKHEYISKAWKKAKLKIIRKAGQRDWSNPSSYRPISLLPVVSKVYERVLKKRLADYIEENNLMSAHQFDFRQQKGTIQAIELIKNTTLNSQSRQ